MAGLFFLGSCIRMYRNGSGRFGLNMKKHFFTKMIVNSWNRVLADVVDAPAVKRHFDNAINTML